MLRRDCIATTDPSPGAAGETFCRNDTPREGALWAAFPGVSFGGKLVVQLQSELDLTLITRVVTRGADQTEVGVGEVERVADGDDTVTAEARGIEVGVIDDVEELRAEL